MVNVQVLKERAFSLKTYGNLVLPGYAVGFVKQEHQTSLSELLPPVAASTSAARLRNRHC